MKKITTKFFLAIMAFSVFTTFSCKSTDVEEEEVYISTVSANHITIRQTDSKIKITLNKASDEDISSIKVYDTMDESQVVVPMNNEVVDFVWPFGESGKEYMLCAQLINKKGVETTKEFVSFKIEGTPATTKYTDEFKTATLVLVARGNERIVKFNSTQQALKAVTSAFKTDASDLQISIYSGKHYNSDISKAKLVATLKKPINNKNDLAEVFNGYDLIINSDVFGLTPTEMNAALSANKTYFAVATVNFTIPEAAGINFTSRTLYSNDTIYTPISQRDLDVISTTIIRNQNADAK